MSSGGEIQQLISALQDCQVLVANIEGRTQSIRGEFGHARGELREVEYIFYRITSLMARMGLPKEIDKAIQMLQKLILTLRMLHTMIMYMEATTNFGKILSVISGISAAITVGNMVEGY